jgi:4-hydroxybenzoate polyprenyltransferase
MNKSLYHVLRRLADPIIFGNFFIALCAAGLVVTTYYQLGHAPRFDRLTFFIFFATLALYNFHRLMGVRKILPEDLGEITTWAARNQFTQFMLIIIGVGGMGFFLFQLPLKVIFTFIPLGLIAVFYEIPLLKLNEQFHRIRNLWLSKTFLITIVWSVSTALLPAMNVGHSLLDYHVWLVLLERGIFIFLIALCFDARDVIYDQRDGIQTIPVVYGEEVTKRLYRILSASLLLLAVFHYFLLRQYWGAGVAMVLSALCTYLAVSKTFPRKNDYYYLFVADGMMLLQFVLTAILVLFL